MLFKDVPDNHYVTRNYVSAQMGKEFYYEIHIIP